jgi:hypothetical protein
MIPRWTFLIALGVTVAGCNMWQNRAEFAPPPDRLPGTQWPQTVLPEDFPLGQFTSPIAATAPPPPIEVVNCYRTLAIVDCFAKVQPARYYGYTGSYPD